ncbi:MAG: alanine:cation symporter family protein [Oscillospiraceae bacterium]|jgi:AGCS family alanine or glycine:cation symporter|nr:alanine:cation symporter family protein [Oscillospiraceae bacterium]
MDIAKAIADVNGKLNSFIWGPVMLVFFILVGLMFTVRTKVFQVSKFGRWMNATFLAIFKNRKVLRTDDKNAISQFQSLCTALAATIGTGNIVGVATAIALGGPGAVFWMWFSAFLGMMTNYAENTLGIKYRYRDEKGRWVGGAMIYIEKGLKCKWLAVIFSVFCALASFGIGNMTQANSIASGLADNFFPNAKTLGHIFTSMEPGSMLSDVNLAAVIIGIVIMAFVALVILGGIKRIASVTEKFVPFMAVFYVIGGLIIILVNANRVPAAFGLIFKEAFNFNAGAGGIAGYGIAMAARRGISRGVFSNEAGLGSSVMVHSASDVEEPVVQGMWGIFEVFADTIIVCSITALSILASGVYDFEAYNAVGGAGLASGAALTSGAFATVFGSFGGKFVSIAIMLFAFSTILGWSYYGERAVQYLLGLKAVTPYKIIFIAAILVGCTLSLGLVWDIADTLNGFMAVPNLIAITLLSGQVVKMTKDYLNRGKPGLGP